MTLSTDSPPTDRGRVPARASDELEPLGPDGDRIATLARAADALRAQVELHEALLDLILEAVADRLVALP